MTPEKPRPARDPKRLELLLETAQLGDWELDPETLEANCSDLHFAIFGYQQDEYPVWSLDRFLSHVISQDRSRVSDLIQEGLRRQTGWSFESRITGADLVDKWIAVTARFFADEGKPSRVLGVVVDVSRRKALEIDELRRQDERDSRLHHVDRRLADMVQGMTEACFALDRDWRFTFVNGRCQSLFRHSREQMLGQSIWEIFQALVGTWMEERYRTAMRERRAIQFEVLSPIAGRWLDIRLYPTSEGLAAFLLDIHERKLAEYALRQSEQQWVAVFENLREGLVLSDIDGKLLYWNRAGLAMCGYNHLAEGLAPRVEHAQTFEILELSGRLLTLEEWPLSRVLRGEVLDDQELCFRRVDKGWEKVFAYSGAVIKEAGGRPVAFLAMRDITDRKSAELALRESERRFRETLDTMMEGCQIIGRDWRYLYVNEAAARHGKREASELLGRTMMECYPGIEEGYLFQALGRVMKNGPPEEFENDFLYPDGTLGVFQLYIQAVQEGVFVLSLDVSQRKEAERQMQSLNILLECRVLERTRQLEIANQELEAFSYSVSHDLRTPLRAIEGFSRVLSQNFADHLPGDAQRYLKGVRKGAQQMALLIDDLLRFSQVNRHQLQLRRVDMRSLVEAVLEDLIGDSGAAEVCVEGKWLPFQADPESDQNCSAAI